MDFRRISNISVECVIFGLDTEGLKILLSKRHLNMFDEKYPIINDWILTGQHILKSEKLDESADRIFKEFTGLEQIHKKQFRTFGNPERIKNSKDLIWLKSKGVNPRTMSIAYYFLLPANKIKTNKSHLKWFQLKNPPELGFDHLEIITKTHNELQQKSGIEPLIFELLPDKFTLNELQFAHEAVFEIKIDNRNFRKKALGKTYIVGLDEKRTGNSKKPSNLFMFSKDVYKKTADNNIINF